VFTDGVPDGLEFDCSGKTLRRAEMWNLITQAGRMAVAFRPSGTEGFEDLVGGAVELEGFGVRFSVASLEDIIRSKEAADRPQDRQDVAVLRAMLEKNRGTPS
jgi:hypothetical protein